MTFSQRWHFDRVISDESRLDIISFAEFAEDFVYQLAFSHCIVYLHVQFLADFADLFFIHSGEVVSCKFFDWIEHGNTLERSLEVDYVITYLNFCCTVYIHTDLFDHIFSKLHHPVVILVGYVNFHTSEFWVMSTVHTFITEVLSDFVYTFKSTYDQTFQVKFAGNTHIQRNIKCIMVSNERTCRSSSGDRLQDRSFNFDISFRIEILTHRVIYLIAFQEYIFYSIVYYQVYVALAVTEFWIIEFIVSYTIFIFYDRKRADRFWQNSQFLCMDRNFTHLSTEYETFNADKITQVEQTFEYYIV